MQLELITVRRFFFSSLFRSEEDTTIEAVAVHAGFQLQDKISKCVLRLEESRYIGDVEQSIDNFEFAVRRRHDVKPSRIAPDKEWIR